MRTLTILILLCIWVSPASVVAQRSYVKQLVSYEFHDALGTDNVVLLDVRTPGEFSNGHIPLSGNLNYYNLDFKKKLRLLPKDANILLYCNTGYRSNKAAKYLVDEGYTNVSNLEMGIMEWELEELPIEISPDAQKDTKDKMDSVTFNLMIESEDIVMVDFYAPWCGPCRKMMPLVDSLQTELKESVLIAKVNVDASKSLVKQLKIRNVPYIAVYKKGKLVFSHYGAMSRDEFEKQFHESETAI